MVTVLVLFCVLLILSFVVAVLTGIIAVSPLLLLIFLLPALDYFIVKLILKKRKK